MLNCGKNCVLGKAKNSRILISKKCENKVNLTLR